MKKSSDIFQTMRNFVQSEEFVSVCRLKSTSFTRKCMLDCRTLFSFILNLLKQSIPIELHNFTKFFRKKTPTRSAVSKARPKLSPKAYVALNNILIRETYQDNEVATFHGLRIFAIDGTALELPIDSSAITEKFGGATNHTETITPTAKASYLCDVINGIVIDAIIAPYKSSERDMSIEHLNNMKKLFTKKDMENSLVIMDRGYPSAAQLIYFTENSIPFLMRCNSKFIKEVGNVVLAGQRDSIITIPIKRTGPQAKNAIMKLFPSIDLNRNISARVVVITLITGEEEVLITNLEDMEKYSYTIFEELYFKRWGIEEKYKFHKVALEIENWSGKSPVVIEQDFHAVVLVSNARALLAIEAAAEIKREDEKTTKTKASKYKMKINKNVSVATLKNEFIKVLMMHQISIEDFCQNIKSVMKEHLVPIRPGRRYKRIRQHSNRKWHMNTR